MSQSPERFRLVIDCEVEIVDPVALGAAVMLETEGGAFVPSQFWQRVTQYAVMQTVQLLRPAGMEVVSGAVGANVYRLAEGRYPEVLLQSRGPADAGD